MLYSAACPTVGSSGRQACYQWLFAVTLSATAPFITDKTDETDGTCYEATLVTPKSRLQLLPID